VDSASFAFDVVLRAVRRTVACAPPTLALLASLSLPLHAQAPAPALPTGRFDTGIVVGGDWLQGNALPLNRESMHSVDFGVSLRRQTWAVEAGWLRIARDFSTVQGVYVSGGPQVHWGRALFIPSLGVLGGESYRSVDSTGYDFVVGGVTGHQTRYSYSDGFSVGASVGLAAEVAVYRAIGVRALVSEWFFSGEPLSGDRARTVLGVGLSLRVGR
jgi:hypothetical protein